MSASTSRYAPSTLIDSCEPDRSRKNATMLAPSPAERDDQHQDVHHVGWVAEPPGRLDEHVDRHAEQQHRVGEGGEDLQPVQAERVVPAFGASAGELDRGEGHAEADHVGEHVAGVGDQRQRVGDDAGHDLHQHEDCEDGERYEEPALVPLSGPDRRVTVIVSGVVISSHSRESGPTCGFRASIERGTSRHDHRRSRLRSRCQPATVTPSATTASPSSSPGCS